jgi:predicted metal-dependent hydrolase
MRTSLAFAKRLLNQSRADIRQTLAAMPILRPSYSDGDLIGKSHQLKIESRDGDAYGHKLFNNQLLVWKPSQADPQELEHAIRQGATKALRAQAKAHLPRRLAMLAVEHQLQYQKLRFSSAGTRWGSCTSRGTISLTIWLMQLPFELIDYVLIHELCHLKEMNHSPQFWKLVASCCPDYAKCRSELKQFTPTLV